MIHWLAYHFFFDHEKDIVEALVKETAYFEQEPLKLMQVLLRIK